jgi:O-antigen/teichoic acid export membrane protein
MTIHWVNYLPKPLRQYADRRQGLQQIAGNVGWLSVGSVLQLGLGLFVSVWVARYLGPTNFGHLSYAIALTMLFGVIAKVGMDKIIVRDIVNNPIFRNGLLGTAFILKFIGGMIALALSLGSVFYLRPADKLSLVLVAIIGAGLIFQALEVIGFWFESQVQSKYVVFAKSTASLLLAVTKVLLILSSAPLVAFAWTSLAEVVLGGGLLLLVYRYTGERVGAWRLDLGRAQQLLRDGWPFLLSAITITVYMRIDQVMLAGMADDTAVGIYSAATRLSEAWYFVPLVIISSVFPSIIRTRARSKENYLLRLQILYECLFLIAFLIALVVSLSSSWIIHIIFGNAYLAAVPVLAITSWVGIAAFLGQASSQYLVAENLGRHSFYRTLIGAIANVFLNWLWIPEYGAIGAAYATLISYFLAVYSLILFRGTFEHGVLMMKSSLPVALVGRLIQWYRHTVGA